jgi:hypothetical protein
MNRPLAAFAIVAVITSCVACGGQSAQSAPEEASPESALGEAFAGTIGTTEVTRAGAVATLVAVRAATHEGFDRVVFELAASDVLPGHHIEYVDKPVRDCGAGDAKEVAGDAWLEVRMSPMNAHTEEGQPTIPLREQALDLPVIRELERTCDFEAVTTWVIGVGSPNPYRVVELSDPPRLVVDIAHASQAVSASVP